MDYHHKTIESFWLDQWEKNNVYQVTHQSDKPKYYVLEMFPYPSGAGLHVGHPLGYIASDIFARYKRLKGFNVLHPMGFDAFGLPAEQYAIETGQHPADTTAVNIKRYKEQLRLIGLSYDWSKEVQTCDPAYYKWTQWIFLQLFESWFNPSTNKAENISTLREWLCTMGSEGLRAINKSFTAKEFNNFSEKEQADIIMQYRLAFIAWAEVNWCEALGTVLANDEVVNGVSERGGHPVVKKKMRQWFLRISEYADRLLTSLDTLDWPEPLKEMQRNWIGKSKGAYIEFEIENATQKLPIFTTRPDTIFGASFMVLAPELDLVKEIYTEAQRKEVEEYIAYVKSRSDVDRMAEKKITGCFTGAYATNPFSGKKLPIWISEYVLAGYGTGAIMAVPCGDERDFNFATHFNIDIPYIFEGKTECYTEKDAVLTNSDFLNGKTYLEATEIILSAIQQKNLGHAKTNYKMRDAGFSRQRYWGEPFPIYFENDIAKAVPNEELPVLLPHVKSYSPGPEGQGPLANLGEWVNYKNIGSRETNTMPGYAGSSWYFLRYMDPNNEQAMASPEALKYWNQVDLYVGGSEHAVGHLLYSRLWTKVLYDLGYLNFDEPFKKMVNQGMIQGQSKFITAIAVEGDETSKEIYLSADINLKGFSNTEIIEFLKQHTINLSSDAICRVYPIHVPIACVDGDKVSVEKLLADYSFKYNVSGKAQFIKNEGGQFIARTEVEKMSKSKYNVVNPDDVIEQYGADCFRMYEMFLGPIEVSKPWDTKGIEGVSRFLRKLWNLFYDTQDNFSVDNTAPSDAEWKVLHKTIKKIEEDIQRLSFNTAVAQFMIAVNELGSLKCNKRAILEPLLILLNPFAPFITEELWKNLGCTGNIVNAAFPLLEEKYLVENSFSYPVAINGKTRINLEFALDADSKEVESNVLADEQVQKYLNGAVVKKFIFVKGRMINIVI